MIEIRNEVFRLNSENNVAAQIELFYCLTSQDTNQDIFITINEIIPNDDIIIR